MLGSSAAVIIVGMVNNGNCLQQDKHLSPPPFKTSPSVLLPEMQEGGHAPTLLVWFKAMALSPAGAGRQEENSAPYIASLNAALALV